MGFCALLSCVFHHGQMLAEPSFVGANRRRLDDVTPLARGVYVRCPQPFVFRALHTLI